MSDKTFKTLCVFASLFFVACIASMSLLEEIQDVNVIRVLLFLPAANVVAAMIAVLPFSWLLSWSERAPKQGTLLALGAATQLVGSWVLPLELLFLLPFAMMLFWTGIHVWVRKIWYQAMAAPFIIALIAFVVSDFEIATSQDQLFATSGVLAISACLLVGGGGIITSIFTMLVSSFDWLFKTGPESSEMIPLGELLGSLELLRAGYGGLSLGCVLAIQVLPLIIDVLEISDFSVGWSWLLLLGTPLLAQTLLVARERRRISSRG